MALCMTPIGQPCTCDPMTWRYFVFVQSAFVFVGQTLEDGDDGGGGGGRGGVWVSAHPSIGEKLVAALIHRGAFDDRLAAVGK